MSAQLRRLIAAPHARFAVCSSTACSAAFAAAFSATSNAAFTAICAGNLPFDAAYDPFHFPLMLPHGDTGWHLQMPQVQNPTPNPDLMRAQRQQLEEFSALQHKMQAEQQQQQPGANQSSAYCQAEDAALEEVQPSQQNDSSSEN